MFYYTNFWDTPYIGFHKFMKQSQSNVELIKLIILKGMWRHIHQMLNLLFVPIIYDAKGN